MNVRVRSHGHDSPKHRPTENSAPEHSVYVGWLEVENEAFAEAVRRGLDIKVPSCPGWSIRDLVLHHAMFQSWITGLIRNRAVEPTAPVAVEPPVGVDVVDWYEAIGATLVAELRETDPGTRVWCASGTRAGDWARRQASETSVHRWDAQNAFGVADPINHADDYIIEMITLLLPNLIEHWGAEAPAGSLALLATDVDRQWVANYSATGIKVSEGGHGDVTVSGSASEVFLAVWSRPSSATVDGDVSVLDGWRRAISGN